jgi:hypothetical protein
MGFVRSRGAWLAVLLVVLAGCGRAPVPPAGTGAREAARDFYAAVIRQDWPSAYAVLHPDSQKRYPPARFALLAQSYRRGLGFEPQEVHVPACEEQGAEAVAHVVLTGHTPARLRRYKDGVTVRRSDSGWRVLLPKDFGHQA